MAPPTLPPTSRRGRRGSVKPQRALHAPSRDHRYSVEDLLAFAGRLGQKHILALQAKWDAEATAARSQTTSLPAAKSITYRDEANAIVLSVLRNGFIEELHSGRSSPLLLDSSCSRITQSEMKRLMIETSARLATWLRKRDAAFREGRDPRTYLTELVLIQGLFTGHWDRSGLTSKVESDPDDEFPKCGSCRADRDRTWKFCPGCGASLL